MYQHHALAITVDQKHELW